MKPSLITHAGLKLPASIQFLETLAYNLWWSWNPVAQSLFHQASRLLEKPPFTNPVSFLRDLSERECKVLAKDEDFLALIKRTESEFNGYIHSRSWWGSSSGRTGNFRIAYFSAEFGIHESLPNYAGGLGVLAGDFFKATSDLGIPLIGIGLFYSEGYFRQRINDRGEQEEYYQTLAPETLPLTAVPTLDGKRTILTLPIAGRDVALQLWKVEIGRGTLFLLDSNCPENDEASRQITGRLYGGDIETRIKQEFVLGIGGMKALAALGIVPDLCHMNEGHSAFLSFERLNYFLEQGLSFDAALKLIRETSIFTTHTPVAAGHDVFSMELMHRYFLRYCDQSKAKLDQLLPLGKAESENHSNDGFSMTVLGMQTASGINAVSKLHGAVSRKLWKNLWPDETQANVPIGFITNGVHAATWIEPAMAQLYDLYLGKEWRRQAGRPELWERVDQIPDADLWRIRSRNRLHLVEFIRNRMQSRLERASAPQSEIDLAKTMLDPHALTIGFARRFATYKRATMLLQDFERLLRIVRNSARPVQFIFAGKAHPADHEGKSYIAAVNAAATHPELRGRFVFVDDYDIDIARRMVCGVDVWMNTPRRPLEASGTSGMKAAMNGALQLSILDGWWCEGFDGRNGWAIRPETAQFYEDDNEVVFEDAAEQDRLDSSSLYEILDSEVIPTFYSGDNVPEDWLKIVKRSIRTLSPAFSASRMAAEYSTKFYLTRGALTQEGHEVMWRAISEQQEQKRRHTSFLFPSLVEKLRELWK